MQVNAVYLTGKCFPFFFFFLWVAITIQNRKKGLKMTLVSTNTVNLGHLWHEPKIFAIATLIWLMLTTLVLSVWVMFRALTAPPWSRRRHHCGTPVVNEDWEGNIIDENMLTTTLWCVINHLHWHFICHRGFIKEVLGTPLSKWLVFAARDKKTIRKVTYKSSQGSFTHLSKTALCPLFHPRINCSARLQMGFFFFFSFIYLLITCIYTSGLWALAVLTAHPHPRVCVQRLPLTFALWLCGHPFSNIHSGQSKPFEQDRLRRWWLCHPHGVITLSLQHTLETKRTVDVMSTFTQSFEEHWTLLFFLPH